MFISVGIDEVRSKDAFEHGKIKEKFKAYQMELTGKKNFKNKILHIYLYIFEVELIVI